MLAKSLVPALDKPYLSTGGGGVFHLQLSKWLRTPKGSKPSSIYIEGTSAFSINTVPPKAPTGKTLRENHSK